MSIIMFIESAWGYFIPPFSEIGYLGALRHKFVFELKWNGFTYRGVIGDTLLM